MHTAVAARDALLRRGLLLEYATLSWNVGEEGPDRERAALRVIAVAFVLLAVYIAVQTAVTFTSGRHPGHSTPRLRPARVPPRLGRSGLRAGTSRLASPNFCAVIRANGGLNTPVVTRPRPGPPVSTIFIRRGGRERR